MMKKYLFTILLSFSLLAVPAFSMAAPDPLQNCTNFKAKFNGAFDWVSNDYCTANGLLLHVINIVLGLAGSAAVLFIILGGFWYLSSAGNQEVAEKGQKTLTNAIIGLVVIILSFVIIKVITNTLVGGLGSGSSGGTSSQVNGTNSTGNQKPGTVQFSGDSFADPAKPYVFDITVPKEIIAQIVPDCTANPTGSVRATNKSGDIVKIGDLNYSGGQLSGHFTTDIVGNYGYGKNGTIGDHLPLTLLVCGQNQGGWDINVKAAAAAQQCDPKNNDPVTGEDAKDCGGAGSNATCSSSNICRDISSGIAQCSQSNNDPKNNNEDAKECGALRTCNDQSQCVDITNPNGTITPADTAAANIKFDMALQSNKQTLQINLNANPSDRMAACGEVVYSKLGTDPLQVFINGSSAGSGTAADPGFTVDFPAPVTSSQSVSIKICGHTIGGGAQTLNPPTR